MENNRLNDFITRLRPVALPLLIAVVIGHVIHMSPDSCTLAFCVGSRSSSLTALVISIVAAGILLITPVWAQGRTETRDGSVTYTQKLGAFALDLLVLFIVFGTIKGTLARMIGMPLDQLAGIGSGYYWPNTSFVRDAVTLLVVGLAHYVYLTRTVLAGRQTLGQYVLGFRVSVSGKTWNNPFAAQVAYRALMGTVFSWSVQSTRWFYQAIGWENWLKTINIDVFDDVKFERTGPITTPKQES